MRIAITAADYNEAVGKKLEEYRRKMNLQGFRPGKVPMGVAKKMFGKSVLAEELNKLLSEKLDEHIKQQQPRKLMGYPLPSSREQLNVELDQNFEFSYDLAFAPDFTIDLGQKDKFTWYKILADSKLVEKHVLDYQRRHGQSEEVEIATEADMIYGSLYELDKSGNRKTGGVHNHTTVAIGYVENKEARQKLMGAAKGTKFTVEPAKLCSNDADLSQMLNVPVYELADLNKHFELTVESIHRITLAELNSELFDKVLGPGAATTEAEFRERIAADLAKYFDTEADRKFYRDVTDRLLEKLKLELPDAFLQRWLVVQSSEGEKPITAEEVAKDYDDYARYMRVSLIESKISAEQHLHISLEEVKEFYMTNLKQRFGGLENLSADNFFERMVEHQMKNEHEVNETARMLLERKLITYYKNVVKLTEKEVSFDEFVKLANEKSSKTGLISQITNFLKL